MCMNSSNEGADDTLKERAVSGLTDRVTVVGKEQHVHNRDECSNHISVLSGALHSWEDACDA